MTRIAIIVAMSKNRTIGVNNTLPWSCPEDLKHFKALTMGHHMIMGRKTYDSIGRPLPGRTTVVVSRDEKLALAGCTVVNSLPEAIAICGTGPKIFIVGGAQIYAQTLSMADTLYITEIQKNISGDANFPDFDLSLWHEVSRVKQHQKTPEPLDYHFIEYRRR